MWMAASIQRRWAILNRCNQKKSKTKETFFKKNQKNIGLTVENLEEEKQNKEGSALLTLTRLKQPPRYGVFLLNDDITTMDFVVSILKDVFWFNQQDAEELMLKIHHEGRGQCGVYSFDVAQTKCEQVKKMAKENNFPLQCVLEKTP